MGLLNSRPMRSSHTGQLSNKKERAGLMESHMFVAQNVCWFTEDPTREGTQRTLVAFWTRCPPQNKDQAGVFINLCLHSLCTILLFFFFLYITGKFLFTK